MEKSKPGMMRRGALPGIIDEETVRRWCVKAGGGRELEMGRKRAGSDEAVAAFWRPQVSAYKIRHACF